MNRLNSSSLKSHLLHYASGPFVTLITIFVLELLAWVSVRIPNPAVIIFVAVVYSAFTGGLGGGLISGAITLLYTAYFFSIPGQLFHYSPENLHRIIVLFIATPAVTLMTGILKLRNERSHREKELLIADLQKALAEITVLQGILPTCSACKRIRDEKGEWKQMELYISDHSEAKFSHGLCPACAKKLYPEYYHDISGKDDKEMAR